MAWSTVEWEPTACCNCAFSCFRPAIVASSRLPSGEGRCAREVVMTGLHTGRGLWYACPRPHQQDALAVA
jgi:hypothetical protein